MCGIAGFQGVGDSALLQRMSAAIAHRGPDGAGARILRASGVADVGFAHRRLAIIDLSPDGAQPISVACQRCGASTHEDLSIKFNGEIYNYRELRSELQQRGHHLRSDSDTEVQ